MQESAQAWILERTKAESIRTVSQLQSLWGGCGQLLRLELESDRGADSVILKHIRLPLSPQGRSLQRKKRSYQVEEAWYREYALHCTPECRVAQFLGSRVHPGESLILLEDLNRSGFFPVASPSPKQTESGLSWFAHFHAKFLGQSPDGLWEQGCYWHLDTRPDEWERMAPGKLKDFARHFDEALKGAKFQCFVHGDAKSANFCWHSDGRAAAVDFQYVGRGCGIRDVALFLDRALGREDCSAKEEHYLWVYFQKLAEAVERYDLEVDFGALEEEWRRLYSLAWCDYARFYSGWASHQHLDPYTQLQLERATRVTL